MRERGQSRAVYAEEVGHSLGVGERHAGALPGGALLLDAWRTLLLVGWDAAAALAALWLAGGRGASEFFPKPAAGAPWPVWLALPLLTVTTQFYFDAYRVEVLRSRSRACFQSLKASVVGGVLFLLGLALLSPATMFRDQVIVTLSLLAGSTLGVRLFLRDAVGFPVRPVLVGVSGPGGQELAALLREESGYRFAGFLEEWVSAHAAMPPLSTSGLLPVQPPGPGRGPFVVVTQDGGLAALAWETLRLAGLGGARVLRLDRFYESLTGRVATRHLGPRAERALWDLDLESALLAVKRVADTLLAAALLTAVMPAMLVVAVMVKLTSTGPCLYSQVRVGLHGRMFRLWKFRSMRSDAESGTGPVWATHNDARVTPLGRLLRRSRLDELPQLWNVLRGEMSLIGPRPERPVFVARFRETIPFYEKRLGVRPGLTGWAQVVHRYDETEADVARKLQYDLFYIKHWSPLLDLQIAIKTIATVLTGSGSR